MYVRQPTPLDKQPVIRMNKDVLYSAGVFDSEKELTLTFPELPDDRYASVEILDNDHYLVDIFYKPGEYKIKGDTRFLFFIVRIQVIDPYDKNDIATVNAIQDTFSAKSEANGDFPGFNWDTASLNKLHDEYVEEAKKLPNYNGMMGKRDHVAKDSQRYLAAAAGWGLFPEEGATYLNFNGIGDGSGCYTATYQVPENKAFWSITVYGDDGYLKSEYSIINNANVKLNDDGTFTIYYGAAGKCGDVANRLDITDGWNCLLRIYRPGKSILDGTYNLPEIKEVK